MEPRRVVIGEMQIQAYYAVSETGAGECPETINGVPVMEIYDVGYYIQHEDGSWAYDGKDGYEPAAEEWNDLAAWCDASGVSYSRGESGEVYMAREVPTNPARIKGAVYASDKKDDGVALTDVQKGYAMRMLVNGDPKIPVPDTHKDLNPGGISPVSEMQSASDYIKPGTKMTLDTETAQPVMMSPYQIGLNAMLFIDNMLGLVTRRELTPTGMKMYVSFVDNTTGVFELDEYAVVGQGPTRD